MGGDAVCGGVPEARALPLEEAAVRLRDRDRNAQRYGPHWLLPPDVCAARSRTLLVCRVRTPDGERPRPSDGRAVVPP
ncbi:hypothetical protein HEK616_61760 [Streptomyces nigrescens]|uniref:NUDIX hydrolase n=1 Tax=Streptomyces nigrescens TaxID=1920 RepID=A0ABM8A253_STRNI|nr:hypothetical protein HEK616_61760 [Streptomyces nigrescens]